MYEVITNANSNNTIILDDNYLTFNRNPRNGIFILIFDGQLMLEEDNTFLILKNYFDTDEFKHATDVKKLDFSKIYSHIEEHDYENYQNYLEQYNKIY